MRRLMFALDFLRHHRHLGRVFTIDGRTYRVCCDCGTKFAYSLTSMSLERRTSDSASRTSRCDKIKRRDFGQSVGKLTKSNESKNESRWLPQKCYIAAKLHRYTRTTAYRDAHSATICKTDRYSKKVTSG
jgi:hypothetical protein